MKAIKSLVLAGALVAAGFTLTMDAYAARGSGGGGSHGGSWSGGGHSGGGYRGGGHYHGGGHWYGGGYRYWGFYLGAPLLWSSYYWGYPYAYNYYYPRAVVVESVVQRYPQSYPEGVMEAPTTVVPPGAGAPAQGPAYMNFCESAQAYYPKVTACPEGWKFQPTR